MLVTPRQRDHGRCCPFLCMDRVVLTLGKRNALIQSQVLATQEGGLLRKHAALGQQKLWETATCDFAEIYLARNRVETKCGRFQRLFLADSSSLYSNALLPNFKEKNNLHDFLKHQSCAVKTFARYQKLNWDSNLGWIFVLSRSRAALLAKENKKLSFSAPQNSIPTQNELSLRVLTWSY